MRLKVLFAGLLLSLLASPAWADFQGNCPANTVAAGPAVGNPGPILCRALTLLDIPPAPAPNFSVGWPSIGLTPLNEWQLNVGNYPLVEQPAQGLVQGFASYLKVPSSYTTTPFPNTAISAYTLNGNPTPGGSTVALFGFGGLTTNGASVYGSNVLMVNTPHYTNSSGGGFNFTYEVGYEADIGVFNVGANPPSGLSYGFLTVPYLQSLPLSGAYGYTCRPGSSLPFSQCFRSEDGAASVFASIGQLLPGTGEPSQAINFNSQSGGGVKLVSTILQDSAGDLEIGGPGNRSTQIANALIAGIVDVVPFGNAPFQAHASTNQNIVFRAQQNVTGAPQIGALNDNNSAYTPLEIGGNPVYITQGGLILTAVITSSLPSCNAGNKHLMYEVDDANSPTYGGTLSGSGSTVVLAICDGTNWKTH